MPLPKAKSNSFASNSFFIFITRFFPSLANLLVVIWYSNHLSQQEYGNYQHFWIQLSVLYPLACFGVHALLVTYSRDFILKLARSISATQYILYGVWAVGLAAVFAWLQSSALQMPFAIPFIFLLCWGATLILESFLIVCRNYTALILSNVLFAAGFCFVHWYALQQGFSLTNVFLYVLLLVLVRLAIYGLVTYTDIQQKEVNDDVTGTDIKSVRSLWMHLGVYDVSQILFNYIDKFIISIVLTAQVSAVYFNGSQTIPFLPLLLSAAGSAVLMLLAGRADDDKAGLVRLMNQSGMALSCVVFPVFFFLFLFREEFMITIFTEKYREAIPVFAAALLVLPVKAYSFTTVLQRMHKGGIINAGAVVDLVLACALMYPMYLWLGLPGVALSFVITTYLQAAFYLVYSSRLLKVSPLALIPWGNWGLKLIVFFSLFIGIHYVGSEYFDMKMSLILGGVVMVVAIAISLLAELKKQKNHVNA